MQREEITRSTPPEIMTAHEFADYLRLHDVTVCKLAMGGKVPAVKVGRNWRFKRDLMDEWLRNESTQRMAV